MKTDIEYAAMVMGDAVQRHTDRLIKVNGRLGIVEGAHYFYGDDIWAPDENDGDSRRLEIECLNWSGKYTEEFCIAWDALQDIREYGEATPEQYREAVFALAVAIGKVIDGGGV